MAAAKSPRAWPRRDEASIFGLTISSFVGQWSRHDLARALPRTQPRRHSYFFERDVRYYSAHRDLYELRGGQLELYQSLETVLSRAERQLADAEVALVGRAFV